MTKKKLTALLAALSLLAALTAPAGAWEYPSRKYRTFQEYLDFYRAQADEDTQALAAYIDRRLAEGWTESFDADAYFQENMEDDILGVNKENWLEWNSDGHDAQGAYDEEWFRAEMLNHYLTQSYRAFRESEREQSFFGGYCVTVNGSPIPFGLYRDTRSEPVAPKAENDRLLVPLRATAEALGLTVEWKAETNQVICASETTAVTFTLDSTEYSGGTLDVAPYAENGVTYLPLRALGEALGCEVTWYQDLATAALTTAK